MSEMKSLREAYKFDKWDLYFGNDEINKCKGTFVLHVVDKSPTFESWIKDDPVCLRTGHKHQFLPEVR